MDVMELTLSVIATITSSVALIGVAIGLIFQGRQLKANQLQVVREMHLELSKMGIENPSLIASVYGDEIDLEDIPKANLINLTLKYLEAGYQLGEISKESVRLQAGRLFSSEYSRNWWALLARNVYKIEARTKSEKEFFEIVDISFNDMMGVLQSSTISGDIQSANEG
jgi:hypothetical protein